MSDLERLRKLVREMNDAVEKLAAQIATPVHIYPVDNRKKLTKRDVVVIRSMKRNGVKQSDIAEAFDVNPATISRIVRGIYHR